MRADAVPQPGEPTPPLDEFLVTYLADDNVWWAMDSGHHMNLFDAALERMEAAEAAVARVRELAARWQDRNGPVGQPYYPRIADWVLAALDGTDEGE